MIRAVIEPGEGGGAGSGGIAGGTEAASIAGKNLREGGNVSLRPKTLTSRHLYNLRNQTWAIPKPTFDGNDYGVDTIYQFYQKSSRFPSNADNVNPFIYANTNSTAGTKSVLRFDANSMANGQQDNTPAPMGYFIIDALDRGTSRIDQLTQLGQQYSLNYTVSALPTDSTPSGPTIVAEYAGRIWYSGFSGEIIDGDTSSPKMSSYVLFSQLFTEINSLVACYQEADPTSPNQSDLVDTDGGMIRIEGAYNINGMYPLGSTLIVLAENGIWQISGGNSYGFTATNYKVNKITDSGCISSGSIVVVENSLLYWGRDGIYAVSQNQYGDYVSENLTRTTIQTYYNAINSLDIKHVEGVYDSYEQRIKWLIHNKFDGDGNVVELLFDTTLKAFYKFAIKKLSSSSIYPLVIKGVPTQPFTATSSQDPVVVGINTVTVSGANVYVNNTSIQNSTKEVVYLVILGESPTVTYTFATYRDETHYDWRSIDGVGVDAYAYLLTGTLSGGDYQRGKSIPHITVHMTKTENGFTIDGTTGDWIPLNQSSCLVQVQWDWTNSVNSNKWTTKRQMYRFRRQYTPSNIDDTFDNGYYIVETMDKIRGSGKVMSVLFETEPGKHLELLGWSLIVGTNGNV